MNDPTDDIQHSMAYGLALHEAGVLVDMRFYAEATSAPITTEWPELVMQWLRNIHVL